jgi:hypothetical protein
MSEHSLSLRTTPYRYFVVSLLPVALVMGLASALGWLSFVSGVYEAFLMGGVAAMSAGAGALFAACIKAPSLRLELRDATLRGPAGFGAQIVASLDEVDVERSARRSRFQRAVGEQIIWFRHGGRMVANHRWYPPGELSELLRRLGIGDPGT